MQYGPPLATLVDGKAELEKGAIDEVSIRAGTVVAVEEIIFIYFVFVGTGTGMRNSNVENLPYEGLRRQGDEDRGCHTQVLDNA